MSARRSRREIEEAIEVQLEKTSQGRKLIVGGLKIVITGGCASLAGLTIGEDAITISGVLGVFGGTARAGASAVQLFEEQRVLRLLRERLNELEADAPDAEPDETWFGYIRRRAGELVSSFTPAQRADAEELATEVEIDDDERMLAGLNKLFSLEV